MKNKIMLLIILGILFSLPGLAQTPVKSSHPKMDAFFHPKQDSTKSTATKQIASPKDTVTNKITASPKPVPAPPVIANNKITSNSNASQNQSTVNTKSEPAKQPLFSETRLGSSSKLYDTYEKNNNGAGAVTTSPK